MLTTNIRRSICSLIMLLFVRTLLAQEVSVAEFEQFALTQPGDVKNGAKLFKDKQRTKCAVCHIVDKVGGNVGPDLSRIGSKFDRSHLIESLLEPSRQIVEGYRSSIVLTEDGSTITGIIKAQSDESISIQNADGKIFEISRREVEAMRASKLSLMPDNLAEDLSLQEFVDLIAYLETLRTGFDSKFGAGVSGPVKVTDGFKVETVVTNLSGATAMQPLDDGRILLCEQTGSLRVFKNGQLLSKPMLTVKVDNQWERGLIGVTVDPDFPSQPYVYVCYVSDEEFPHHRVSRFTISGDVADPDSEKILLIGDDQRKLGGHVPAGH